MLPTFGEQMSVDFIHCHRAQLSGAQLSRGPTGLSSKIGFVLHFYSVFENEQLKVKVFQIQYSDFVHFYLKNRKLKIFEQCNEAQTPFKNVLYFLTKMKFPGNISKYQTNRINKKHFRLQTTDHFAQKVQFIFEHCSKGAGGLNQC